MPSPLRSESGRVELRRVWPILCALSLLVTFSGCVAPISISSNPTGATVSADGKTVGTTPTQFTREGDKAINLEFSLDGYFPESYLLPKGSTAPVSVDLFPRTMAKEYAIRAMQEGVSIALDGKLVGTVPIAALPVTFTRDSKHAAWKPHTITASKTDYQTESVTITSNTGEIPPFNLTLLRDARVYVIKARTSDGGELNADVTVDGKAVGQTPLKLPLTFLRADKTREWPKFKISVEVPAKYKPQAVTLDIASAETVDLNLEPILEITTQLTVPALVMAPTGITFKVTQTAATAVLSTRESSEVVADLKPVTDYRRKDLKDAPATRAESINSFCVAPDGQNVIFSLTERDEEGGLFSNLFIKRSDDAAGGVARLTQGSRSMDTLPYIANDGSNYLVFVSNRSDRSKPDIYRVNLIDNRLSGGISRLTNDNRFNFAPSYGDSNRQLYYLSTEPNFPRAESVISSIRIDGSLPTQLSIGALEINNTFAEKVYFVKTDDDTKKKQIYSITADGKLETALLNQEDFRKSNCFNAAVSPDGTRVLFVSDVGADENGRPNNDIYLINSDGTGLLRLTQNGSDDIQPAWSPTEEGVLFFLSNRGGAYNIWRMKVSAGTK